MMKKYAKKSFLVSFFSFYHLFMPFVMINCGSAIDEPYDKLNRENNEDGTLSLEQCNAMPFLTVECAEIITAEQERIEEERRREAEEAAECDPELDENCEDEGEETAEEDEEGEEETDPLDDEIDEETGDETIS